VSQTVTRQRITDIIRAKLATHRALKPDADFVRELEGIFEEHRRFRSDREAVKLTVLECCEPTELKKQAPLYLSKLPGLQPDTKSKTREEALEEFGESLTSTRNMIVHSKANYTTIGSECPSHQMQEFSACVRIAAEQVIRWYSSRHEEMRIA
jgi:hypothetical protein